MKKITSIFVVFVVMAVTLVSAEAANSKIKLSTFSDKNGNRIPLWMENSYLLSSELVFNEPKTIGKLFGSAKTDTVVKKLSYTDNTFTIAADCYNGKTVTAELTMEFKCARMEEKGTCFISSIVFNSPLTFTTASHKCSSPNGYDYGTCLGIFSEVRELFFD